VPATKPPTQEPIQRFTVSDRCIGCGICAAIAPCCFAAPSRQVRAGIRAQPMDASDQARCLDAQDNCPVDAIGSAPVTR
jgi:ferredoxin